MTFSPKKKTSKSRTNQRTGQWQKLAAKKLLDTTALQYDAEGNAIGLSHFATVDGMYRGRSVYSTAKSTKKITKVRV